MSQSVRQLLSEGKVVRMSDVLNEVVHEQGNASLRVCYFT